VKAFQERNLAIIGAAGLALTAVVTVAAYNFNDLPGVHSDKTYTAYFEEAGGLTADAPVQVSGVSAGHVKAIALRPDGVLVTFTVDEDIRLGDRTEAAISTISVLGNKVLDLTPRGEGRLNHTIPLDRTTSPYQLPDALGDLTATISGLKTDQLSDSLRTLSQTLQDTPPQLRDAVQGVARFSETIANRDAQLRSLLANASTATTVLGDRTAKIADLIRNTNAVLAELQTQSDAIDHISGNIAALATQIHGFVTDNRSTLKPTLDKLNGVLTILDNRKAELRKSLKGVTGYGMALGESLSSGPFFKAYLANLVPGQFAQPFIDAAFSDLGLDPTVLAPSQLTDPEIGQPGTPALPVPYPRTGQGGEPRLTLPDAITGTPDGQQCGPPGLPLPGPGCYPLRDPLPAPPPGGPPPGPPALPPTGQTNTPPSPSPVFQPAPGEVPPSGDGR
jgi:phospholipid/cholesterol/gamma-HCH transport system substrate-binding protein